MTFAGRPLAGRSVLVTRDPGEWPRLRERLELLGAAVTFRSPTWQVPPQDAESVDAAVDRLPAFDWIVFTSGKGVRFLADVAERRGRPLSGIAGSTAAVGSSTARAVAAAFGRDADIVSRAGHGRALGNDLATAIGAGRRVLVVRPEVSAGGVEGALREAGVEFEEVAVYRTVPAPWAADVAASIARGEHDIVVFTAPSAARTILEAGGALRDRVADRLREVRRVALGPTTAKALDEAGLPADVTAAAPTEGAAAEAVVAAASAGPGPRPLC